jgi:hypothetical protein
METKRIKSTYKIFGGFGLLLILSLLISLLYFKVVETQIENNIDFTSWLDNKNDFWTFIILSLFEMIFLSLFMTQTKYIIIDNDEINFINPLLPFFRRTRQFSEYDFYITTVEQARGGEYEAIWLIKNNKIKDRISCFYYSNYNELKDNLNVRNRGERKTNPFIQPLYLLGLLKIN